MGTGDWLLKTAEFQTFLSSGQRTLWCPGIRMSLARAPKYYITNSVVAGAGKTVLTLVHAMSSRFVSFGNF